MCFTMVDKIDKDIVVGATVENPTTANAFHGGRISLEHLHACE